MGDFFQIFIISRNIEILMELNFWLGMYILKRYCASTGAFKGLRKKFQWKEKTPSYGYYLYLRP